MGHRQISHNWHQLTTEHGTFFGYSEQQAREKADAYRRKLILAQAAQPRFLPLLPRQCAVRIA